MGKLAIFSCLIDLVTTLVMLVYLKDNVQIDWSSFVAQGEAVLDGIFDYSKINGPMGPIAYLPGHAYLYAALSYFKISSTITASKVAWTVLHVFSTYSLIRIVEIAFKDNKRLRYLCAALYLLQFRDRYYLLMYLQNDTVMIVFFQYAILFLLQDHVFLSILFFNLSLSIKIGVIMWLPGFLLILAKKRSMLAPVFLVIFTGAFQYAIAYPFLKVNKEAFVNQALGASRRLAQKWAVLYYYTIPSDFFYTKEFTLIVYGIILGMNLLFLVVKWTSIRTFFADIRLWPLVPRLQKMDNLEALKIICTSALIQAIFNFNYHPQFFIWFNPIFPVLLTQTPLPNEIILILGFIIEHGYVFSGYNELRIATVVIQFYLLYTMWTCKWQKHIDQENQEKQKQISDKKNQ